MKLFRNKTFLTLLIAACLLCSIPSVLYLCGAGGAVRDALHTVTLPVSGALTALRQKLDNVNAYFGDRQALLDRIAALEAEVASAEGKVADAQGLQDENAYLKGFLSLAEEHPEYRFVYATVAGCESGGYSMKYMLNAGSRDGVGLNMPVLTELGLVGYVSEVGSNYCYVSGLFDSETAVGAVAVRTGETGILSSALSLRQDGCCKLSRLSVDTALQAGDRIETAGGSGIYPAGLLIGQVGALIPDTVNLEVYASVIPAQDPDRVVRVMILTACGQ